MQFIDAKSRLHTFTRGPLRLRALLIALLIAVAITVFITLFLSNDRKDSVAISDNQTTPELTKTDPIAALASELKLQNPAQETEDESTWLSVPVKRGDTLLNLFKRADLSIATAIKVSSSAKKAGFRKPFNRLYPKEQILFKIENGKLVKARHVHSRLKSTLLTLDQSGAYQFESVVRTPDVELRYTEAAIGDSMFLAAEAAGLPQRVLMSMANIFGWDIDFARDIRSGDRFNVLYEQKYIDGELIGVGEIVAAEFINQSHTYTALRYTTAEGTTSYYTPEGESMKKSFLRNPVDFARISSRFNLKRKHPILNRIRAHKGVDYAAPRGTPIRAAGDGTIVHRSRKGGYGKTIILKHGSGITTLYAHMNNYRRGFKRGSQVKQGDIIGYVGTTGLSTGPHLHYEFRVNGVHKNPLAIDFKSAAPIPTQERQRFAEFASILLTQLRGQNGIQLAKADQHEAETVTQ